VGYPLAIKKVQINVHKLWIYPGSGSLALLESDALIQASDDLLAMVLVFSADGLVPQT
jgi:hypothetical protein